MPERRRPYRRGRGQRAADDLSPQESSELPTSGAESNPYLDVATEKPPAPEPVQRAAPPPPPSETYDAPSVTIADVPDISPAEGDGGESFDDQRNNGNGQRRGRFRRFRHRNRNNPQQQGGPSSGGGNNGNSAHQPQQQNSGQQFQNARRNRRPRQFENTQRGPIGPVTVDGEAAGWFDLQRDAGFIRNAKNSYLPDINDPFIPLPLARQYGLRRGDLVAASVGHDQRNRVVAVEITAINGEDPALSLRRADFQSLVASYPDRKLTLETGRPAKGGPELTRRAIDVIAPIGYGQRALIVAPARAGKTMLLQAVIEGIAINHPQAALFVLLVDERPEEVSDMITLGYGEVIASSFDMPAVRHTDVAEMTLERARRLVELGRDVVIVLDSITRLARAYNTVERGTGRTLSGGLDSSAMAKPKAFFGSARSVAPEHGGGSLTIIATALVETGSRMDDVIFEEFKGTGNCEIKLDRGLAEKRIFPAIDIGVSGTRREDKLFRPDQLEHVYTLRRGLQQMPSSSGMEWLIKRIASTTNNDALLAGL
jgi:transcription termination factor Rho